MLAGEVKRHTEEKEWGIRNDGREGVRVGPSTPGRVLTGKEGQRKQSPEVFYHWVICSNSQEYSLSEM